MNNTPKSGAEYWGEEPQVYRTVKNMFRYYPRAKRLTVSLPDFYPKGSLEKRPGKSVSVDLYCMEPETLRALIEIFTKALEE